MAAASSLDQNVKMETWVFFLVLHGHFDHILVKKKKKKENYIEISVSWNTPTFTLMGMGQDQH